MTRSLGLPLLLVTLAIGGYLVMQQSKSAGPTSPAVTQDIAQASSAVAGTNFQAAGASLQAWLAEHATYAGATLDPSLTVQLVRADATSYCLQSTAGTAVEHEIGPGGQPQPGPC
ncbi:MAG: hypothetical protein ACXVZL_10030 [Gaiellaceae bacterium]